MAKAKEAVETFLELGAKYEVVLVGLADEVTKQRRIVETAERNAAMSSESAANATRQMEATRHEVSEVLGQVREALTRIEQTREQSEATMRSLEGRLRELIEVDQHQGRTTDRLARVVKRNTFVVGALSVVGTILGLVALLA